MSQAWSHKFLNLRHHSEHVDLVISSTVRPEENRIFWFLKIRKKMCFIQIEFFFAEAHWVKFRIKWGKNLNGRYGHLKEEYTCWCQSFITLKIQFSYLPFPDLLEYSCFQSTSSRHLITRPKIRTSLRSIRRQTCDSILSKILRTKLWLQFFLILLFMSFFFPFYIRSCKWYGNLK